MCITWAFRGNAQRQMRGCRETLVEHWLPYDLWSNHVKSVVSSWLAQKYTLSSLSPLSIPSTGFDHTLSTQMYAPGSDPRLTSVK
ncbi:hypothetical protein [Scytonema sp. PCC 10023]|uniref:hypothetical protein n=1 Tax=Scytonema sp. PCC 10023 TaxID=1680591 RepID=UPI0039C65A10